MKKLKVFEAFSGYGSQSIALRNIGVNYEVVAISEINKYAIKAYEAIHGQVNNLGDISKIDVKDVPEHDLFTYSFPCTDVSIAGKREGIIKGQTRSGLLYECERIIEHCKPKYLLLENVKNLVGKKFKLQFDGWLNYLEQLGYTNYWSILNSKDYGVPQNRERVFVVSILGDSNDYKMPSSIKLVKSIKDILEDNVDNRFYLDREFSLVEKDSNFKSCGSKDLELIVNNEEVKPKIIEHKIVQNVRVRKHEVDVESLKSLLRTSRANNKISVGDIAKKLNVPKTKAEHWFRTDNCFSIPDENIWLELKALLNITTDDFDKPIMEFEVKPNTYDMSNRVYGINGISPTLTCTGESGTKKILESNGRIRRLTPRECFRLMGVCDKDIDKIENVQIPVGQQYKLAGNSIVVQVLEHIFTAMLGR